ncbi:unnamed protein product [Owenia fusiformis]|uniref:Uncharacterized protein n=1 Tax=Owenia fusiformis TaxID=6347 RepID=A0A8S4Q1D9_OWEFU|nr:unnamed protein product [Owenia fusiformis]
MASNTASDIWEKKMKTFHTVCDRDNDGVLTRKDYEDIVARMTTYIKKRGKEPSQSRLEAIRKNYVDVMWCEFVSLGPIKGNERKVSVDEFTANVFRSLAIGLPESEKVAAISLCSNTAAFYFDVIDFDENGTISYDEYEDFLNLIGADPRQAKTAFDSIDVDGNGTISREEFASAFLDFWLNPCKGGVGELLFGTLLFLGLLTAWALLFIAAEAALPPTGVTFKPHHFCRDEEWLWWGENKDYFDPKCSEGEMIKVTNAELYPVQQNLTCVMNNSECRHDYTKSAFDTCINKEVCLPMVNYEESKKSCCEYLLCHTIEFECVPATCKLPSTPSNGQILTSEQSNNWNGSISYSCKKGFSLAGEQTRRCIRKGTEYGNWAYTWPGVEYSYTWSGNEPVCVADMDQTLCPSTAYKKETLGSKCYEFHDDQQTTFQNAKEACGSRKWKLATIINADTLGLIRHHMDYGHRSNYKYWINVDPKFNDSIENSWCAYAYFAQPSVGYYDPKENDGRCSNKYGYICEYETLNVTSCDALVTPKNAHRRGTSRAVGSIVRFSCYPGYTGYPIRASGTYTRECRDNGKWDGINPDCQIAATDDLVNCMAKCLGKPVEDVEIQKWIAKCGSGNKCWFRKAGSAGRECISKCSQ